MKADKISESGIITDNGQLRLPMDRVNAFFSDHKNQRVVVRFEVATPGSTAAQQSYFYQYVLPTLQQAFRETGEQMTEELTERYLFWVCPFDFVTADGTPIEQGRQLNQTQMSDFLDWLKQFAAENLYVYIEDPKTL